MTTVSTDRRLRCDLCNVPLPEHLSPYHRDNRKSGECMCFVSSDGGVCDD